VHIGLNWDGALKRTPYFTNNEGPTTSPPPPRIDITPLQPADATGASRSANGGIYTVQADGKVVCHEGAEHFGDVTTLGCGASYMKPWKNHAVDILAKRDGYYILAFDGGVWTFGDLPFAGSMGDAKLAAPVMAGDVMKNGYWLASVDGGVFSFGKANYYGNGVNYPVRGGYTDFKVAKDKKGYYLLGADGGVFSFGSARFRGSLGNIPFTGRAIKMLLTPSGDGYWIFASDGGVFSFGDAEYFGSYPALPAAWREYAENPLFVGAFNYNGGYGLTTKSGDIYRFPRQ